MMGSALLAVALTTTPRSVTAAPLSVLTVPPSRAAVVVTAVEVGVVTTATPATPPSLMIHKSVAMMLARAVAAAPGE